MANGVTLSGVMVNGQTLSGAMNNGVVAYRKAAGGVDKSALEQALSNAAQVDRYQWTAATVGPFDQAYSDGQTIYSDNGAAQTDVDNATTALNNAMGGLVTVTFTAGSGAITLNSSTPTYQIQYVYNGVGTIAFASSNPTRVSVSQTGLVSRIGSGAANSAITVSATGLANITRPVVVTN